MTVITKEGSVAPRSHARCSGRVCQPASRAATDSSPTAGVTNIQNLLPESIANCGLASRCALQPQTDSGGAADHTGTITRVSYKPAPSCTLKTKRYSHRRIRSADTGAEASLSV